MSIKIIQIDGIGEVRLAKSAAARSLRLTVNNAGKVRVSLPRWSPFVAGEIFANSHIEWIKRQLATIRTAPELTTDKKIGKLHHLEYQRVVEGMSTTSRVTATKIIVKHSVKETVDMPEVQARTEKAVHRALRKEAEQIMPPRVREMASRHGFSYASISAKQLKRRWGSCDSHHKLVFNFFLMELPWELIDYVILHELTHTEHLNHGPDFWRRLKEVCPDALDRRDRMRKYRPMIGG